MRFDANLHYLDNAATTMVSPEVAEIISAALQGQWANPSSLYAPAIAAEQAMQKARRQVAQTLGARAEDIYFTACGSEGNNLAILGQVAPRRTWGSKIVVSGFEHPSVQRPIRALAQQGMEVVEILPEADGTLDIDKMLDAVDKTTVLVACMAVNNETGARQDIARLADGVKAKNSRTVVHIDAVQAWLRIPLDLKAKLKNVDSLAVSGHKIHAPKGVGALYLKNWQNFRPPYLGGHQERGLRPGTENLPYLIGLGAAAAQGQQTLQARAARMQALNARLRAGLSRFEGFTLNSPPQGKNAVPEVLNFSTNCVKTQTMINELSDRQIYLSGGSACDQGEPSHTLQAMHCAPLTIDTALRASFCADNTEEDVDALLAALAEILTQVQHI